jgi:RNA polymerase sigma-70 factor (ECF subfamily)
VTAGRPADSGQSRLLESLLAACGRKDRDAFAHLYRATSAKLFGVALRILKRRDWAEEVLQDCYLSIWHHAGSYSAGLSAPMTWLTSIVRNRCLDWLRRPNLEVALDPAGDDDADPLEQVAGYDPGPLDALARSSEAKALAECLRELDAKQRQAIMLAFFGGLTHSELAAHLREPLGTVKTWIRRGLLRLQSCLE